MRVALGLEYDGHRYYGWQRQDGLNTIQAEVEKALSKVANHLVIIHCAGRTDAGVHATSQVIHFDTEASREEKAWVFGTNFYLPPDIRIRWAQVTEANFHARFSATARRYCYFIYNEAVSPAILNHNITWYPQPLDIAPMNQAAKDLLGEHDFTSYRAAGCQSKSSHRNVTHLQVIRDGPLVYIDIKANAFLHHMVRNIVGVLLAIGTGKADPNWAAEILAAQDRRVGGVTAPSQGLFLVKIDYPRQFNLRESLSRYPFFLRKGV